VVLEVASKISDIKPQFNVKLTMEEMRYITIFQDVTSVTPRDCIVSDELNSIVFVVDNDKVGLAVGKRGYNVKYLAKLFGKSIDVVGWAENLEEFVKNIFTPARVYRVQLIESPNRRLLYVYVDPKDKGIAIGKNGRNVVKAKILMNRYYGIDGVVIY
jgi:N utilization substance protein A